MSVVGVLTAGGDCPGLNAVIRGVVARADERDAEVVGIRNGWEGLMNGSTLASIGAGVGSLFGIVLAALLLLLLIAAAVVPLQAFWARVTVRVAGSWVMAVGMLMFGWFVQGLA